MTTALILGISGQDGSYLAEHLNGLGYDVHGFVRRTSTAYLPNLATIPATLHYGDMTDELSLYEAIKRVAPDELYNLAAQSFVKLSYVTPVNTGNITALGTMRALEIIRLLGLDCKFYQAGSSEMFGLTPPPQSETTPFQPISPYSVAKVYSYYATRQYRETYGLFAVNGILFNHESPRRGAEFVSRKIAKGVAAIAKGQAKELRLGTLDAKRDWSHAKDMVRGMHLMLQYPTAKDWVLASGESHSVEEFVAAAFAVVDLDWHEYVVIDEAFKRPSEVNHLQGDATQARRELGWQPEYSFAQLVEEMVQTELLAL